MLLPLYRLLTDLGAPAIAWGLRHRLAAGKEDKARFAERLGQASRPRPEGKLLWCHAASVGEAMSVLSLLRALRERYPGWSIVLTTGTVTSARLIAPRLPEGVIHQFVPVDRRPYAERFLEHWKPNLVLWVESELWPNLLMAVKRRRVPALLLNGRMSAKSFRAWSRLRGAARSLLETFSLGLAQTDVERERFAALGLRDMRCLGNLKYAGDPLPYDAAALEYLRAQIGTRPVWLMASTHPGEEEIALAVHQSLKADYPNLLTIIAPRHAVRGEEIEGKLLQLGAEEFLPPPRGRGIPASPAVTIARRSRHDPITPTTAIYLADSMGELGLFYRLAPLVCLGGSFTWGGHNPIEPAQLGCALVFGPRMPNFAEIATEFVSAKAAFQVQDTDELTATIRALLSTPKQASSLGTAAQALAERKRHVLQEILGILEPWLRV